MTKIAISKESLDKELGKNNIFFILFITIYIFYILASELQDKAIDLGIIITLGIVILGFYINNKYIILKYCITQRKELQLETSKLNSYHNFRK